MENVRDSPQLFFRNCLLDRSCVVRARIWFICSNVFDTAHHSPCPRLLSHPPLYHARMQTFISSRHTRRREEKYVHKSISLNISPRTPRSLARNTFGQHIIQICGANLIYSRCLHKKFVCAWLINPLACLGWQMAAGSERDQFLCVTGRVCPGFWPRLVHDASNYRSTEQICAVD